MAQATHYFSKYGIIALSVTLLAFAGTWWGLERIGISAASLLAMASLPLVIQNTAKSITIWPIASGFAVTLCMGWLGLSPLFYLTLCLLIPTIIARYTGQQGIHLYLLLGFGSSAFSYIMNIFGFPLRLWLSKFVANALAWIGFDASAQGNIIYWHGQPFAVDEACMGLHLTEIGMVISIFIIGWFAKTHNKHIPWHETVLLTSLALMLLVLTNLSRIAGVVLLQSPPNTLGHELIGLFSLGMYTLLPIYFLIQWRGKFWQPLKGNPFKIHSFLQYQWLTLLWTILVLGGSWYANNNTSSTHTAHYPHIIPSYYTDFQEVRPSIWKGGSEEQLIYIKGALKPYKTSHSPMICWQGSGYTLQNINLETIGNDQQIYRGELVLDSMILHTAWWYASSNQQTVSQLNWRWQALRHQEEFFLVNITCASKAELNNTISEWIKH